mgnify:CR=1 FL=1
MTELLCINTGIKNLSDAGKFQIINTKFSNYIPKLIFESLNTLKSEIILDFYIKNNKIPNKQELKLSCKDIYILGPVYTNYDTQIGFTGKNKMKIENNIMFVESHERTIMRELFEESGLIIGYNLSLNNGNIYNLLDFYPVRYSLNNNAAITFINQKDWFDVPRNNKTYKFNSATIITCSKDDFINCYSNSETFFKKTRKLFKGDNISHIACINMFDIINYLEKN